MAKIVDAPFDLDWDDLDFNFEDLPIRGKCSWLAGGAMAGAAGAAGGAYYSYTIDNSCRFNAADSAHMTRTNAGGDQTEFTVSFWVKRSNLAFATTQTVISQLTDGSNFSLMEFIDDALWWWDYVGGVLKHKLVTTRLFRDPSAWYHIVYAYDSDQGTAANRIKLYVNGTQVTAFSTATYPASAYASRLNGNFTIAISARPAGNIEHDGYLAEFVFIDGDQLTAASFGETNDDGIWVPKDVSGLTFANESFYLDFKVAPGTGNGAGTDVSGRANHFTDSGLAANDQVADSPTNNYCTLNSVWKEMSDTSGTYSAGQTYANGNLDFTSAASTPNRGDMVSTMGMLANATSGAIYYAELTIASNSSGNPVGGISGLFGDGIRTGFDIGWHHDGTKGGSWHANTSLATHTAGDVLGFIVDCANNVLWVTKDGTYQTGADSGAGSNAEVEAGDTSARNADLVSGREYYFVSRANNTSGSWTGSWNFGQHAWNTAPPANARALNEASLATDRAWAITQGSDYFSVTLYTGNASADTDIDVGFDVTNCLALIKNRDQADAGRMVDTVRGATLALSPAFANLSEVTEADGVTAFGTVANNIRLGTGAGGYNDTGEAFVAYTLKEDPVAGFDIVAYTGNGANRTIAHSLGIIPQVIIAANRPDDRHIHAYHSGVASDPETDYLLFSAASAVADDATIWNDTAPTSSVFSLGTSANVNDSGDSHIAWLLANVEGFLFCSYYFGNGNLDGPFIYCGFRPRFVMLKNSASGTSGWMVHDTARNTFNPHGEEFILNITVAEASRTIMDILSNGFKIRGTDGEYNNASQRMVFIAIGENPFPRSKAR